MYSIATLKVHDLAEAGVAHQHDMASKRRKAPSQASMKFARQSSAKFAAPAMKQVQQKTVGSTNAVAGAGPYAGARGGVTRNSRMFSVKRVTEEAAGNAAKGTKKVADADMRAPIGIITCTYLGSVSVPKQQGNDVVRLGLGELAKAPEFSPTEAAVVVSLFGLKVVEVQSSEILAEVPVRNITFTANITDIPGLQPLQSSCGARWNRPVFGLIHVTPQLKSNTVELFQVATPDDLAAMQKGITSGTAQLVQQEKTRSMGGKGAMELNPFSPTAETADQMYGARFSSEIRTRGCHWFPHLLA
jgi:hypothetical protein